MFSTSGPALTLAGLGVGASVTTSIRVGCYNVRGIESNHDYARKLLNQLDVCAITEHWLHDYDLHHLRNLHADFNVFSTCSPPQEDTMHYLYSLIHPGERWSSNTLAENS